jgi:sugar phosphate isomerase/epimerase
MSFRGDQSFDLIAQEPDYCLHVHIAGEHAQPGVGDMDDVFLLLFRILRDIGYTRGVSAACLWVSADGGELDFGKETAESLRYLQGLRDKVYAE